MEEIKLTPLQLKALKYVKKRATAPTTTAIALYMKMAKANTHIVLTRLVRLGCLESFLKKDAHRPHIVAERHYIFLSDTPKPQPKPFEKQEEPAVKKFSNTRVTVPKPFYSDPFNITGVRDANQNNKRKHKRA
jgi:hypothetical protein